MPAVQRFFKTVMTGAVLLAVSASGLFNMAHAQTAWPSRPIKMMVPFAPGGSNDVLSRALAQRLAPRLGQPVIIENRGGAGGIVGTEAVTKSTPDGYTLLFISTAIATGSALGSKLPYDVERDLAPIGQIGSTPLILLVSSTSKVKTQRELIELARANPTSITYGSAGVGSMSHLGMELLAAEAKAQFLHVPYKGIADAFNDVIAGHLQIGLSTVASTKQLIDGGRLRALAVTSLQRSPFMPNLPTSAESGLPGFEIEFWWGLLAPARTPGAIIKRLNDEMNAILVQQDMHEQLSREAVVPRPGTPEDFRKLIASEVVRWTKLVKDANIKAQ